MKSRPKIFFGLIMITLIVALGFYLSKTKPVENKDNDPTKTSSPQSISNVDNIFDSVIFLTNSSDSTDIYSVNPGDKIKRVIFTDKDEDLKIKQCQSVVSSGKKLLAAMGAKNDSFISSLWFVTTDGKGEKEELMDSFASPNAPIASPDGKKIAYIVFSNVEADYGFSLLIANNDGTNKQTIAKDTKSISNIAFSPDGKYLFYTKGAESGKSGLFRTELASSDNLEIYSLKDKEAIYSVSVSKNNQVAISMGPIGNNMLNQSEIYLMDIDGKDESKLFSNEVHENYLRFSPDGKTLAYLAIKYEADPKAANISGTINLADIGNKTFVSLNQEADIIIGWLSK